MSRKAGKIFEIGMWILLGMTVLSGVKAVFVSLDIDESYAVAQAYRMVRGDRLIMDMWEPHQFSAFLSALFAAPYIWITGTTDYLLIYLRVVGICIHVGLGIGLYRLLRRRFDRLFCLLLLLLHLNFLPKWVQLPEFEVMHYWFLLAIFLLLGGYFEKDKPGGPGQLLCPFAAGICLAGCVLCYPTMLLLYPFYLFGICMLERQYHHRRGGAVWRGGLFFTAGCLVSGLFLLGYLFSYMSLSELRLYLGYIFLDTSHTTYTQAEKWRIYLGQWGQEGLQYLIDLLVAAGILLIGWLVRRMCRKKKEPAAKNVEWWGVVLFLIAALEMQWIAVYGFLLDDQNQFYQQLRYIAVLLPGLYLAVRYRRQMAMWLYLCVLPGFVSLPAVLFITNMNTNVSYSKAFLGVLGAFLICYQYGKEVVCGEKRSRLLAGLQGFTALSMLIGLFVCRLLLVRVTGCLPVTILAPMEQMTAGPEKGIFILRDTARVWNDNYQQLEGLVEAGDRMLYFGAENLIYVAADCEIAAPSTQGTTVYNEMYLYYYEEHPERKPNVIVLDKTYSGESIYPYSYENQTLLDWLAEEYADAERIETDYMTILRIEE